MIKFSRGNILEADVEALVNTVNCVGVMGRGVALQFKNAFPDNFKAYAAACKRREIRPGQMFTFNTSREGNPRYIVNFPTKRHWKGKSRIRDIGAGLEALVSEIQRLRIRSIAVPPLGCGLGGLKWSDVRPMIEDALSRVENLDTIVFVPGNAPTAQEMARGTTAPKMSVSMATLVGLIDRYLAGLMAPYVTLLEVHKLLYFQQVAGQPLRLKFAKAPYGPYADNLRHVLNRVEGHFITGYADGGDAPDKIIELIPAAVMNAFTFLDAHPETRSRFDRVVELVEGFETPFGMELLATVHWAATKEGAHSPESAIKQIHRWSARKKMFKPEQIKLAYGRLEDKGWLHPRLPL